MKLFLKIGKLLAAFLLTVLIILFSASYLLRDKVGFILLNSINKNLSTKVKVGSYKLSFIRKFPNASLELNDVLVHSSSGFNSGAFIGLNTDTLLSAKAVSLEFSITDILKGVYNIERISARNGKVNLFTDSAGHVNYNITVANSKSSKHETIIDLKRINITGMEAYYNNLGIHLIISGPIKNGVLKTKISGNNIDFTASSDLKIMNFRLYDFQIEKPVTAKLGLVLRSTKDGTSLHKGLLHIDNYDLGIDGFISSDNLIDLIVTGHNLDIAKVRNYIPARYIEFASGYNVTGVINASGKIKGIMSRKSNPQVEINWQAKNVRISNTKSSLTIKDLSFDGYLSNGAQKNYETSIVAAKDLKANFGSSSYTGYADLKNFNNPVIDMALKGRVYPSELKEFFDLRDVSAADGSVDMELKVINGILPGKKFSIDSFFDMKPEGNLVFNSFSIGLNNNKFLFSKVNGTLVFTNSVKADKLRFIYKKQNIKIDGVFNNLPEWLLGRKVVMTARANIAIDKLIPETFMAAENSPARIHDKPKGVNLPNDVRLDLTIRLDSLRYKTFLASEVEGTLIYQPKTLTYKSLKMKSLDGVITGSGFFAQNKDRGLIVKGNYQVKDIDVNKAFRTFHNFGQSFLKAENIKGTLSGSLILLLPVDSLLKFNIKTLTAEGKYHLVDGALINFDPVKQLSSFIELSELKNITFDKLENDFFIRNNFLYIPQMDVKSSAVDLSVNGKHSFDNEYEYHVKMLLSQILSRKRVRKSNITEFGVVEDDGLGRTSLLLKIEGKGEVAKVGYDVKAAGAEIKTSFKKEKQSLKTILNQEYGWYKGDSALNQKQTEQKKQRFKIKWDDQ